MAEAAPDDAGPRSYFHDDLMVEYYRLVDTVASFDQRLLTVKSWGVTFSLATLALGFQQDHYGLFLVAAAGALGFWLIEGSTKSHQIRYYPRMSDIEVIAHELYAEPTLPDPSSSPLINWGWQTAARRIWGDRFVGARRSRVVLAALSRNRGCRSRGRSSIAIRGCTPGSCCGRMSRSRTPSSWYSDWCCSFWGLAAGWGQSDRARERA